ncbi:Protein kinase domain-containing protein [Mycena venus]|uniref:Protein kinase domain-containing protein n=1 Tax=Mycena venus TaxID=2733690 RepID=A0A8H7D578_9AGAR|nr:Protein kinase domain-containing protein [Mycena venus]
MASTFPRFQSTASPSHSSMMASTFPSFDSSPSSRESSPSDEEGLPPINVWSSVQPGVWDIRGIDSDFKYRVWFTWRLIKSSSWNIERGVLNAVQTEAEFWKAVSRAHPDEDIWFWEDEDEECLKAYIEDHAGNPFEVSEVEWSTACVALKARDRQHQHPRISSPVSHLTPEIRFRFMAWLVVVAVYPKVYRFRHASLRALLQSWSHIIGGSQLIESCGICQVSAHLNLWVEIMLHVYSVDHLQSIPWDHPCSCFHDRLAGQSGEIRAREMRLERGSAALRVLLELIVPPWLLILWVIFLTAAADRTQSVVAFLEILQGPDHDLFAWDYANESDHLSLIFSNDSQIGLYPKNWMRSVVEIDFKTWTEIRNTAWTKGPLAFYMDEIDLKTWMEIMNTTWTKGQLPFDQDDLKIRLTAASLLLSTTTRPPQDIIAPLHITLDHFPFTVMADVVDEKRLVFPSSRDIDCKEFWAASNLDGWLLWKGQLLCEIVWQSASHMTTLERIQFMHLPFKRHYRSDVENLFTVLKDGKPSEKVEKVFEPKIISAADVHGSLKDCLEVTIAGLVLFLQDRSSYKELLTYRGTNAQTLLDLLQDFLDLDSFSLAKPVIYKALWRLSRYSGLHPRCFVLTGLRTNGRQVAGGGFGDIWKGAVGGQTVCVKIMRIFQADQVQTLLKEFSREALIWRQLCHPNVLPFFGLYYLENRLCLVSPWMENGNIMEFLRFNPPHPVRLSVLGLEYLHKSKMVHGDLKGINILVTPSRRACIADFGLSSIINAMTLRLTTSSAPARGGTVRYQAPELFQGNAMKTFETDIYAFGCVCYEILTGKIPFHELLNDMNVMWEVAAGKSPTRPLSCSGTFALDSLWELLQNCRNGQAQMRPSASQIVDRLMGPQISATKTSSSTDWDNEMTSRFRRSLHTKPLLPSVAKIKSMLFGDEVDAGSLERAIEHFPVENSSASRNLKGSELERRSKRPYEEETSASHEDLSERNPSHGKRSKLYHGTN